MDYITLILAAVRGVGLALSNPALGGGSNVRFSEATELLNILAALIEEGEDGYEDLKAFTSQIEEMVEQGRSPTPNEWDALRQRKDLAHRRLQAVKAELLEEEEETSTENEDLISEENEDNSEEDPNAGTE